MYQFGNPYVYGGSFLARYFFLFCFSLLRCQCLVPLLSVQTDASESRTLTAGPDAVGYLLGKNSTVLLPQTRLASIIFTT